MTRSWLVYVH